MTAAITESPVASAPQSHIRVCARCSAPYDWRRSGSRSLKMTYCGSLCEVADLGGTIEAMMAMERNAPAAIESLPLEELLADLGPSDAKPVLFRGCAACGGDTYLEEDGSDACLQCGARIVTAEYFPPRRA
jgi:hypothetical protein